MYKHSDATRTLLLPKAESQPHWPGCTKNPQEVEEARKLGVWVMPTNLFFRVASLQFDSFKIHRYLYLERSHPLILQVISTIMPEPVGGNSIAKMFRKARC